MWLEQLLDEVCKIMLYRRASNTLQLQDSRFFQSLIWTIIFREASAEGDVVAGERAVRRLVRDAVRAASEERSAAGEVGEETSAHGVHLPGGQQQPGGAHIQRRHSGPLPLVPQLHNKYLSH